MMDDDAEYTRHLNIEDLGADPCGVYHLRADLEAIHLSRARLVHGGMLFSMLDAAMGRAAMHHFDQQRFCPTVEIKINFFRPAASGRLDAKAQVVNSSQHLCYVEGEILNENDKLVARASGTFFVKPLPKT